MGSGLKSAWELAMEKASKMGGDDIPSLSPDEKRESLKFEKFTRLNSPRWKSWSRTRRKRPRYGPAQEGEGPED